MAARDVMISRRGRRGRATAEGKPLAAVLVAGEQALQDEVARAAAAAGMDIPVVTGVSAALALAPDVLLLGSDQLRSLPARINRSRTDDGRAAPPSRGMPEIIVVALAQDTAVWHTAAESAASRVAILPAAAGWLAGYLGRQRSRSGGTVVGVLGSGGAGASTMACWLGACAGDTGASVLLIEGDAWGPGLEWALGAAELDGIRWPDLAGLSGSLNPVQLAAGLPAIAGLSLLARGNGTPSQNEDISGVVLDAARSGFQLTLIDLGRTVGPESLLRFCDQVLLVVPGRADGVLAAQALLPHLGAVPAGVVVRGPLADGLDDLLVADALGLPLAGYLRFPRGTGTGYGGALAAVARPRFRRAVQQILATVMPDSSGAVP